MKHTQTKQERRNKLKHIFQIDNHNEYLDILNTSIERYF